MSEKPQRLTRPQMRPSLVKKRGRIGRPVQAVPVEPGEINQAPEPDGMDDVVVAGSWTTQRSSAAVWALLMILLSGAIWAAGLVFGYQTSLAVLMGVGYLLAIIGLFVPSLGILAIGMLCALDAVAAEYLLTGGLLRFNTLNYWLLLVMVLSLPFLLRLNDVNSRVLQLFILLLAAGLLFSADLPEGVQDILNLLTTFGIVVYFARSLKDEQALYWLGVVLGFVAAVGGLIFFLQMSQLPYANPNNWTYFHLTALFAICISFTYARTLHKNRGILLLLAVVNFVWVFLSASRGSLLIALFCGIYLFLSTRSFTLSAVMLAFAVAAGIWISAMFAEQQLYTISRLQLLFDPSQTEAQRTSKRSELAEAGLDLFKENPLGIGTGSFNQRVGQENPNLRERPAHSGWIKTLAENGIPGILLLSAFIASFTIAGLRGRHEGLFLFGAFISLVFAFAFIAKEFQGKSLWFLAAAGIVLLRPHEMLKKEQKGIREIAIKQRKRLHEVRFGPKR